MAEYIDRDMFLKIISHKPSSPTTDREDRLINGLISAVKNFPAADVRPVVLCRDCINYVKSEEVNGEKMCVRDADWSVEDGCYYGFTEYPSPDWFCADGKKREEN